MEQINADKLQQMIPTGLIGWYPFQTGARILYIGSTRDAYVNFLKERHLEHCVWSIDELLLTTRKEEFDYILLDCPAGIEQGFKNAVAGADRALVVTTPEVSAIRDADRIVGLLEANEMKRIDLIVNRLRVDMVKRGDMMNVDDVTEILAVNLIGAVPDDEQIVVSTNRGEPLVGTECLAGKAYMNICHRILGEDVPLLDLNQKHGVFEKLKDMFKKN